MIKYLAAFVLALIIIQTLPAEADVQKPVTTTTVIESKPLYPEPVIAPAVMAKWAKVNICETGGDWHTRGPIYSGGLGILEVNWMAYGGWKFGAEYAATPAEQVFIAMKIQAANGYAGYVPDQTSCSGGW